MLSGEGTYDIGHGVIDPNGKNNSAGDHFQHGVSAGGAGKEPQVDEQRYRERDIGKSPKAADQKMAGANFSDEPDEFIPTSEMNDRK